MKFLCFLKRIAVVTSVALVLTLAGQTEVHAQKPGGVAKFKNVVQHHPWLAKPAAWLAMVMLSAQLGTGSVLAQQGHVPQPVAQVAQAQMASPMPLYEAVRHYDYATLKAALEAGQVDVNARNEQGNTGLHVVAIEELYDFRGDSLLHLLLQHGAEANLKNSAGRTALWNIEMQNVLEWSEFLRDVERARQRVADYLHEPTNSIITATNSSKRWIGLGDLLHLTPSSYGNALGLSKTLSRAAILVKNREAFLSLLEAEGEIRQVIREEGEHLLILATRWGNKVVVETLLDYGVNPSVAIFDAAYVHRLGGNPQLVGISQVRDFQFKGVQGTEAFELYRAKRYEERYRFYYLADFGFSNHESERHKLLLHGGGTIIIDNNDPDHEILNLLIARGADVNAIHPRGHTPLHLATEAGDPLTVEILLKNGADPNLIDIFGRTPLHWAANRPAWVNFEITAMILAEGVLPDSLMTPDKISHDNGTPTRHAAEQFHKHRNGEDWERGTPRRGMPVAATLALIYKQKARVYTDMQPTRSDLRRGAVRLEIKTQELDRDAKSWAELSGSETIQKIVAGEMAIEQLLNREIRQQVIAELRQLGLEDEQ